MQSNMYEQRILLVSLCKADTSVICAMHVLDEVHAASSAEVLWNL